MFRRIIASLALVFGFSINCAVAATINQEVDITFLDGTYSDKMISLSYRYPSLPIGQSIWSYSPSTVTGSVSFLDATTRNLNYAQLVFSGSGDIMKPEPYLSFQFEVVANSIGLSNFEVWNVGHFGFFVQGTPGIVTLSCGTNVSCTYRNSVIPALVPLPMPGVLLGFVLVIFAGLVADRRLGLRRHWQGLKAQ